MAMEEKTPAVEEWVLHCYTKPHFYKAILKITAIALYEIAMKSIITIYSYGLVGYKRYILILQCQDDWFLL